jgi:hypothetical protein
LAKLDYDAAVWQLRTGSGNLRCSEVRDILGGLGFKVRDGKKGGHKIYSHPSIPSFTGGNYNCGHGKNPQVGKAYITNILDVLEQLSDEIKTHLSKH